MLKKIAEISCIIGAVGTWVGIGVAVFLANGSDSKPSPGAPMPHFVGWLVGIGLLVSTSSLLTFIALLRGSDEHKPGVYVESAKWYCTRVGTKSDVTSLVQGLINGDGLLVHAHDNQLGDVCKGHKGTGDPKTLEVDIVYRLHLTATHDGWINLCGPQVGPVHSGPIAPPPIRSNQELITQVDELRRKWMHENSVAQGWIKEVEAKTKELETANSETKRVTGLLSSSLDQQVQLRDAVNEWKNRYEETFTKYDDEVAAHKKTRTDCRDANADRDKALQRLHLIEREQTIPQLVMRFTEEDRHEAFIFINEGPDSIQHVSFTGLQLKQLNPSDPGNLILQTVKMTPFSDVGILQNGDRGIVRFSASRESGVNMPLVTFLKDHLSKNLVESDHSMAVTYEDLRGKRKFSRTFKLSSDVYGNVIVHANPVQEISASEAT